MSQQLLKQVLRTIALPVIMPLFALNKRFRILDDIRTITYFVQAVVSYGWSTLTQRFTTWYVFEAQVAKHGDSPCIRYCRPQARKGDFTVETYTYRETYECALRLAYVLYHDYGVRAGEHVAVNYANKPMFLFLWLALWNIGAVPAFVNHNQKGTPLIHSVKISNARLLFVDPGTTNLPKGSEAELLKELPELQVHHLDEEQMMAIIRSDKSPSLLMKRGDRTPRSLHDYDPAMLIYTSGTTGLPKSAIMSWRKATLGCSLFGFMMRIYPESVVLTAMPLYHSTAALLGVCAVFTQGGCIAISNKFSTTTFWKEAYLTKATHIQYVGEVCRYLMNAPKSEYEDMSTVKVAYGNGLRQSIWMDFKKRFHIEAIGEFYASTEAPFATTAFQQGNFGVGACRSYGSLVHWILSYQQTLVRVDPEDESVVYRNEKGFCEVPSTDEPGELLMRIFFPRKPHTSFQGYLGNKKATESKVLRDVFRKGDAWYRSGDLLKSDKYGQWYFVDRMGDTYRWKSENVSTTEVENQMLSFNKDFFDCLVVVGLKIPNHEGRAGFAVIQLNPKHRGLEHVSLLNDLAEHLKHTLPRYALPLFVKFTDQLETTDNYKFAKKQYKNQQLPHGADGNETVYWLKDYAEYKVLTDEDWELISTGKAKL
ncbi:AaceriACL174Wp [[Ashbya] aceris (nom. inval.)]|nr:AaceriACL174Wp [[Ashbya] aceris (nom. inval.)]